MPKILEDRRKAIGKSNPNLSKSSQFAIATAALQKEGKLKPGTNQPTGKNRGGRPRGR